MKGLSPSGSLSRGWEEAVATSLSLDFQMSSEEAEAVIEELREMEISKACSYLESEYQYFGADYAYEDTAFHKGTAEEINSYIRGRLEQNSFSYYFARKFADFAGLFMAVFAVVLLGFLYLQDTRRASYELLHTKPVSAGAYIVGKIAGGLAMCLIALGILNVLFYAVCLFSLRGNGFEVRLWDFLGASCFYILPNMLMIVCIYTLISILFKNPLPAVPLLIIYMVYSNMGSRNAEGVCGYYGRPLAIMVRFQGRFFDTAPPPMALFNQSMLLLASAVLTGISIRLWKRRRM